jgi:hypothetical protein
VTGLLTSELRVYRSWAATATGLKAVTAHDDWPLAGQAEAHCWFENHPAPADLCSCGLYGYYRPAAIPECGFTGVPIFGVAAASGEVVLATRGLRAQRMRILAIVLEPGFRTFRRMTEQIFVPAVGRNHPAVVADLAELAERSGIPVYSSREALLADFPPQDFSALLGEEPSQEVPEDLTVELMDVVVTRDAFASDGPDGLGSFTATGAPGAGPRSWPREARVWASWLWEGCHRDVPVVVRAGRLVHVGRRRIVHGWRLDARFMHQPVDAALLWTHLVARYPFRVVGPPAARRADRRR